MSQVTFPEFTAWPAPDGETFASSALTPQQIATIFQRIVIPILGITVDPKNPGGPGGAYWAVRVGWQPQGQPAWEIDEDVCIITAKPINHPFSRVRDSSNLPNDDVSIQSLMWLTQVWEIHFTFYGPNCYANAETIISAMTFEWVRTALQSLPPPYGSQIYAVPEWKRPNYVPENFQGQWWQRADVDLQFNELITETIAVTTAASAEIELITDTGFTETINLAS